VGAFDQRRPQAGPGDGSLAVGVLGPLEVSVDGRPVAISAGRLRALLAALAVSAGQPVSVDRLATAMWDGELPDADGPAQVQFPVKEPTGSQLSARVDRENLRLSQALADTRKQAKDEAGTARTIAVVGLLVGVPGLGAAAYGLARKRA
jgi:hypothetical protein